MTIGELFDLHGKVAIVTGGNGGLGLGMALGLARAGATIVIAARNADKTADAVAQIKATGANAEGFSLDISQESNIKTLVSATKEDFGRIDILVNNAGIEKTGHPQNVSGEDWDQVLNINLKAAFLVAKEVYPHMKGQGGGKIINIGSIYSISSSPWAVAYSTSKGGLIQLTKSLAIAWAKDNIQVNSILPGWFVTDMTKSIEELNPTYYDLINRRTPVGRWGQPDDLQGAIVFLSSAASNFMTGSALTIDGGYSST